MIGKKLGFHKKSEKPVGERRAGRSKRRRLYYLGGFVAVAAVATVTVHMLTMPAVTMTAKPSCGLEEHTHDSSCYSTPLSDESVGENVVIVAPDDTVTLICDKQEHTHTDACYAQSNAKEDSQSAQSEEDTDSTQIADSDTDTVADSETDTETVADSEADNNTSAQLTDLTEDSQIADTQEVTAQDYGASTVAERAADDLILSGSHYITSEKLEYKCSTNGITDWKEVVDGSSLHGDDSMKLTIDYEDVELENIIESNYKAYYLLPTWMAKSDDKTIEMVDENKETVGTFNVEGGYGVISYNKDWINKHYNNGVDLLNGEIGMEAVFDIANVKSDTVEIGDKTINIDYVPGEWENKYGTVDVQKSAATYTESDDGYDTLTYTLTVSTGDCPMTDIKITDAYNDTTYNNKLIDISSLVAGIAGVTTGADEATITNSDALQETSTDSNFTHGKISYSADGNLVWNIGSMAANETRTLTYTVTLDKAYTGLIINSGLAMQNVAKLSAGDEQRKVVSSPFTLKGSISRTKGQVSYTPGKDGVSGTIKFYIKVTAAQDNTYTVENLRIDDMFKTGSGTNWNKIVQDITVDADSVELYDGEVTSESAIENAKKNGKQITLDKSALTINTANITIDGESVSRFSDFSCYIGDLKPNQTKTLVYSANLGASFYTKNYDNSDDPDHNKFNVYNYAGIRENDKKSAGDTLVIGGGKAPDTLQTFTVTYSKWDQKFEPILQTKASTASMSGDDVYKKEGTTYTEVTDVDSFDVEAGEYQYHVIVNQDGRANVNTVDLTDTLSGDLAYKGYLRVDSYASLTDAQVASIEAGKALDTVQRTAWFDIDGQSSFSFEPQNLGFDGSHAYVLTYYTKVTYTGTDFFVSVKNNFEISGGVGPGGKYILANVSVGVSGSMVVPKLCQSEKSAWYSERYLVDGTNVKCNTDGIYWYIKLTGTEIPKGTVFEDVIESTNHKLDSYDSFKGMYTLDVDTDITDMRYKNLQSAADEFNADYTLDWGDDGQSLSITFNEETDIPDDCAIYIVIRSELLSYPANGDNITYSNALFQQLSGEDKLQVGETVSKTVAGTQTTEKKTGDQPFYFDGSTCWELRNLSQTQTTGSGWWGAFGYLVDGKFPFEKGASYVDYSINTSMGGSLVGDITYSDIIPEGLEVTYLRNANFKNSAKNHSINTEIKEIEDEIASNPKSPWTKYSTTDMNYCESATGKCIYYFNSQTRELRWKLSDVKTSDYISFQLICRIVDEDVLTGVKTANYKNTLNVTQDGRYVDQATTSDIKISKTSLTKELGAAITGNKISFKLDVNKLGEDLDLDKSTVTVIDEMCSSFTLKPETLQFTDKNGNPIDESLIEKKYEVKDGVTYMTFVVPDSMEVIITYDAIINAEEGEIIPEVSNVAHWKGKVSTTSSVWSATNFSYTFLSSVTLSETPSLKVIKLSSEDITKTLAGAEFKVQEATFDSEGNVTLTGDVHTGTTNADGVLYFSKEDGDKWLRRNRVYAVTETKAPTGYNLAQTQYIALTTKGTKKTFDSRVAIQKNTNEYELYVYDSPIRKDYVLPEAGGSGVTPITAIGTALITTGTLSYVYIGRRRRKRRS